jgi:hypothetical protein
VTKCWSFAGWVVGMLMTGGVGASRATVNEKATGRRPATRTWTATRSPWIRGLLSTKLAPRLAL